MNKILGDCAVYGEWMYAIHGIRYTKLPDYFITYDIFLPNSNCYLETGRSRQLLADAGFEIVPLLYLGVWTDDLVSLCNTKSAYCDEEVEGIYIKECDENRVLNRYKLVRKGYIQGSLWSEETLARNELRET